MTATARAVRPSRRRPTRRPATSHRPTRHARVSLAAALHEAGHAVVALALGWRPTRASLGSRPSATASADRRDGEVETRAPRLEPTNPADRRQILACMLAGLEAERRHSRRSVLWLCAFGGAGGDYNAAVALVASTRRRRSGRQRSDPTVTEVGDELEAARRVARDIIRDHWRSVCALARALVRRIELGGAEITRIATRRDGALHRRHEQARRELRDRLRSCGPRARRVV